VGSPELLVKGAASTHTYALRPSEALLLNHADLFFRMSETVEPFTVKIVMSLPKRVEVVTLQEAPGMALLTQRTGATFERRLDGALVPIAAKPYVVFHDAFQYFERRYGLNVVGSISINPEVPPSAKRLTELRRKIRSLGAVCVFAEPQFDTRLVDNLIEGTAA